MATQEPLANFEALKSWRKGMRADLIARRMAATAKERLRWSSAIDGALRTLLGDAAGKVIAFCWPYQGEYDARPVVLGLLRKGASGALPVVVGPRMPLVFRQWEESSEMAADVYGIPIPVGTPEVRPDVVFAALNGFDEYGYRLGYGAGFFDRTLASMAVRPLTIGVGYELARLATIHPQPHDIPMDFIITERGIHRRCDDGLQLVPAA